MVELALREEPGFAPADIEIRRPGKSYSIDTVRAIREEYSPGSELFFIIGLDAFLDLPSWKEPETLLASCHFVVFSRPSVSFLALAAIPFFHELRSDTLAALDASSKERADEVLLHGGTLTLLRLPPCNVSASEIRRRVREGRPLVNLLPASVESYILHQGLYREDSERI